MKLLNATLLATALTVLSVPAFAQGGAPYNASGSQAGGPLGGMQREMGASGGRPSSVRPMKRHRNHAVRGRAHHQRMR